MGSMVRGAGLIVWFLLIGGAGAQAGLLYDYHHPAFGIVPEFRIKFVTPDFIPSFTTLFPSDLRKVTIDHPTLSVENVEFLNNFGAFPFLVVVNFLNPGLEDARAFPEELDHLGTFIQAGSDPPPATLTITAIPAPMALALIACGAGGLVCVTRQRWHRIPRR